MRRSWSSATGPTSSSGSCSPMRATAADSRPDLVDSRRSRSSALFLAVVTIQPPGVGGRPSDGQRSTATAKASWTASSARSMSPKTRTRVATARPELSRKTRATALPSATRPGGGAPPAADSVPYVMCSAPSGRRLPGLRHVLERPDLDRAATRLGATGGDGERDIEVGGLDHPEAADLLLALGERAVGSDDLAALRTDDRGGVRREQAAGEDPLPRRHELTVEGVHRLVRPLYLRVRPSRLSLDHVHRKQVLLHVGSLRRGRLPGRLSMMFTNEGRRNRQRAKWNPRSCRSGREEVWRAAGRAGVAGEDVTRVRLARDLARGEGFGGGGDVERGQVAAAEGHRGGLVDREPDDGVEVAVRGVAADLTRAEDGEPQAAVGVEGQAVRYAGLHGDEAAARAEFAGLRVRREDVDAAAAAVGVVERLAVVGPVEAVGEADTAEQLRHPAVGGETVKRAGRAAFPPRHRAGPEVAPRRRLAVIEADHGRVDAEAFDPGERVTGARLSGLGGAKTGADGEAVHQGEDEPAASGQADGADRDRVVAGHGGAVLAGGREPAVHAGRRVEGVDMPRVDVPPVQQPGGRGPHRALGQVTLAWDGGLGGQLPRHGAVTSMRALPCGPAP